MSAANVAEAKNSTVHDPATFPQHPGEDALAHAVQLYKEQVTASLAGMGLLSVAEGGLSDDAKCIVDVDLTTLPALPESHRDFHRREEARIRILTQNKANEERRFTLMMAAWTKIYSMYKRSTEVTAPVLSRELFELCDLSRTQGLTGGYYDGPRAHRIVHQRLGGLTFPTEELYECAMHVLVYLGRSRNVGTVPSQVTQMKLRS